MNFKPISKCLFLNICWGTPVPGRVCASKPWSICNACRNLRDSTLLGAEIWSSEKVDLDGSKLTCPTLLLLVESLSSNTGGIALNSKLSGFRYVDWSRGYSQSKSKVVRNCPQLCTFLAPEFFLTGFPEFWNLDYWIELTFEPSMLHRAVLICTYVCVLLQKKVHQPCRCRTLEKQIGYLYHAFSIVCFFDISSELACWNIRTSLCSISCWSADIALCIYKYVFPMKASSRVFCCQLYCTKNESAEGQI